MAKEGRGGPRGPGKGRESPGRAKESQRGKGRVGKKDRTWEGRRGEVREDTSFRTLLSL